MHLTLQVTGITMGLTLGEAAKRAGRSKPTILKALQSGKVSGQKQPDGTWSIEPAELFRVWPPATEAPAQAVIMPGPVSVAEAVAQAENTLLRLQVEDLKERLAKSDIERVEAQNRVMALLESSSPKPRKWFWQR